MKGDRIICLIDTGGFTQEFTIEARKAGRRVEVDPPRNGVIVVREVSRGGAEIRAYRFMASRVVALVEDRKDPEPETGAEAEPF